MKKSELSEYPSIHKDEQILHLQQILAYLKQQQNLLDPSQLSFLNYSKVVFLLLFLGDADSSPKHDMTSGWIKQGEAELSTVMGEELQALRAGDSPQFLAREAGAMLYRNISDRILRVLESWVESGRVTSGQHALLHAYVNSCIRGKPQDSDRIAQDILHWYGRLHKGTADGFIPSGAQLFS